MKLYRVTIKIYGGIIEYTTDNPKQRIKEVEKSGRKVFAYNIVKLKEKHA